MVRVGVRMVRVVRVGVRIVRMVRVGVRMVRDGNDEDQKLLI